MKTTWWGINVFCPKCKIPTQLYSAAYSADGELRYVGLCPTCNEAIVWEVFASKLQHIALLTDMNKQQRVEKVVPKVQVPQEPLKLLPMTDDDKRIQRELGIDPRERKKRV